MKLWLNLILCLVLLPSPVMAMPAGARVVGGTAVITQPNGQTLSINQLTDKAIINWKGFSINVNELVKFVQPNANSVVLNRVTGVAPFFNPREARGERSGLHCQPEWHIVWSKLDGRCRRASGNYTKYQ